MRKFALGMCVCWGRGGVDHSDFHIQSFVFLLHLEPKATVLSVRILQPDKQIKKCRSAVEPGSNFHHILPFK